MTVAPEPKYDAFVSYSHKDKDWVRNQLLPTLEDKGLKIIIDFRDFKPGAPSLTEMERAVKESQKTILVLTPNYLNSAWSEFEAALAGTLDPAGKERKILPILLQSCDIPLRISYLTYLNFTDPSILSLEWLKLFSAFDKMSKEVKLPQSRTPQVAGGNKMNGIPSKTANQLRTLLAECDEFSSDALLRALFNDPILLPFKSSLREGSSAIARADLLIDFLGNQRLQTGEGLLVVFLRMLSSRIPSIDEKHNRLETIIAELETPAASWIGRSTNSATANDLMNRIDKLQNDLSVQLKDVKVGLSHVYLKIQPADTKILDKILNEVHQGRIEQGELNRTIESTRRAIKYILDSGVKINDPQLAKTLTDIYQSVNSSLTLEQQFELTIPIIPLLLEYKIVLGAGVDLQAVWDEIIKRIRE